MAAFADHDLLSMMMYNVQTISPNETSDRYKKGTDKPIEITELEFKIAYTILKYVFVGDHGPAKSKQPFVCLNHLGEAWRHQSDYWEVTILQGIEKWRPKGSDKTFLDKAGQRYIQGIDPETVENIVHQFTPKSCSASKRGPAPMRRLFQGAYATETMKYTQKWREAVDKKPAKYFEFAKIVYASWWNFSGGDEQTDYLEHIEEFNLILHDSNAPTSAERLTKNGQKFWWQLRHR